MFWALFLVLAVAWAIWMLPLLGPEAGRGAKLWIALDDLRAELKARRLVKEARRELAERQRTQKNEP